MNKPTQSAVGADNADEQIDPGIHMSDSPVMLSRSEASLRPARQTLRGVYPERSEWALSNTRGKQHA